MTTTWRSIGFGVVAVSAVVFVAALALWCGTGLPYPDSTPELLQQQSEQEHRYIGTALAAIVSGIAVSVLVWRSQRKDHA